MSVIGQLPPRFAHHFDEQFARQFLVAAVDLTARFTAGWRPPSCVAQEQVVRVISNQVEVLADAFGVDLHPHWAAAQASRCSGTETRSGCTTRRWTGSGTCRRYRCRGLAPMGFAHWFVPFNDDRHLPPYAQAPRLWRLPDR